MVLIGRYANANTIPTPALPLKGRKQAHAA